jgi:hypothetical protein
LKREIDVAARVEVLFELPDGHQEMGSIFIGIPKQDQHGYWYSAIGDIPSYELPDMRGSNALQALSQAFRTLGVGLRIFLETGGKIYEIKDRRGRAVRREFEMKYYFGQFLGNSDPIANVESDVDTD